MILMLIAVILKTGVLWPNWAGAKMWAIPGLEWTDAVLQYSVCYMASDSYPDIIVISIWFD